VKPVDVSDTDVYRRKYGIPAAMASCHTAVVDGYVLEGHVPAADIKRLLTERPKALGLAVPGMPATSPGMDSRTGAPYDVLLVLPQGSYKVYAHYAG